jgi:histidyl-tRNA synthetase
MVMENQGIEIPAEEPCALYIAGLGEAAQAKAFELVNSVRSSGLAAETDVVGRGLRPQMKYADKIGARFSMVIGDNELEQNSAEVKNMTTGEKTPLPLDDSFADKFAAVQLAEKFGKTE